jgi:hypothetical protein
MLVRWTQFNVGGTGTDGSARMLMRLAVSITLLVSVNSLLPAQQQQGARAEKRPEILVGVGLGRRDNPWRSFTGSDHVTAGVLMASLRPHSPRRLLFEVELGYWQESKVSFQETGPNGRDFAVTTRLIHAGVNLLLRQRLGRFYPRIGAGIGPYYHRDSGSPSLSEVVFGANLQIGGEFDFTDRLGAYAVVRGEVAGTQSLARGYTGVVLRPGTGTGRSK